MATAQVSRFYGVKRNVGDIIHNRDNNSVFANIEGGFFGRSTVGISKDTQYGGYVLTKSYKTKDGQDASFIIGRTFPVKDKAGNIVEGLTQGLLGLGKEYDKSLGKDIVTNNDALQITTHKLKPENHKQLGDSNLYKVGYITGVFMIEKPQNESAADDFATGEPSNQTPDIGEDEIPF